MTPRSLFDELPQTPPTPLARASDPVTSHEAAAEHIASGANARQRAAVLEVVLVNPFGLTSDEIASMAGLERHQAARRCPELERDGLIRRGEVRPSSLTGNNCITWKPA